MTEIVLNVAKCAWLPVLLTGSLFTRFAGKYSAPIDFAIWTSAMVLMLCAIRLRNYYWAAGFLATTVAFSPFFMLDKIFLLLVLACITTLATVLVACRPHPMLGSEMPEQKRPLGRTSC